MSLLFCVFVVSAAWVTRSPGSTATLIIFSCFLPAGLTPLAFFLPAHAMAPAPTTPAPSWLLSASADGGCPLTRMLGPHWPLLMCFGWTAIVTVWWYLGTKPRTASAPSFVPPKLVRGHATLGTSPASAYDEPLHPTNPFRRFRPTAPAFEPLTLRGGPGGRDTAEEVTPSGCRCKTGCQKTLCGCYEKQELCTPPCSCSNRQNGQPPLACETCADRFWTPGTLAEHSHFNHSPDKHIFPDCCATFISSDALVQHAVSLDDPTTSNLDRLASLVATLVEFKNSGHHNDNDDEDMPASRWEEEREAFRKHARSLRKFTKREGPGGYDEYVFADGCVMSGPIGFGYFGKTACFDATPVFCGNKEDFSNWARQMGRKLYNDTVCFPTTPLQVDYIFSRLGGKAAEHFRENLPDGPGELLHELLRFFGDPHYHQKARARFDDLSKTRQYINEPGIDLVRRLSAAARTANITLDLPAVHNRLNPTWTHALANELADDDIPAQTILDLIVKRSFVIDGADYKRIHLSRPEGKTYVPPSLTCGHKGDSAGRCSYAAFRSSVPTIAAASKGVDWTQYPLCPSAAATQNTSVEWLGDLTLVPGLRVVASGVVSQAPHITSGLGTSGPRGTGTRPAYGNPAGQLAPRSRQEMRQLRKSKENPGWWKSRNSE